MPELRRHDQPAEARPLPDDEGRETPIRRRELVAMETAWCKDCEDLFTIEDIIRTERVDRDVVRRAVRLSCDHRTTIISRG